MSKQASWVKQDDTFVRIAQGSQYPELPSGLYTIKLDMFGNIQAKTHTSREDEIIPFQDGVGACLIEQISEFEQKVSQYSALGFSHRRGYLLHGPPGTGKTTLMLQVAEHFAQQNSISIVLDDIYDDVKALEVLRKVETRLVLLLIEDIEQYQREEEELLQLLDGLTNVNNRIVVIATTNDLQKVPSRIADRHGRFDQKFLVEGLTNLQREQVLTKWLQNPLLAQELASRTKSYSMAMLKELAIQVGIFGTSPDEALASVESHLEGSGGRD